MMSAYQRMVWWYLTAPVLLFLLSWYRPIIGFPLSAGLAWMIFHITADRAVAPLPWNASLIARIVATALLAALLTRCAFAMTGNDWPKHYAVFYDLVRCHWPIGYDLDRTHYLFSYYIPYYLPATAMATLIGQSALPELAELWTFVGYTLALWGYFRRCYSVFDWVFLFLMLMPFANWNIFEYYWTTQGISVRHDPYISPFQWVPQHVLPVWLGAALFFQPEAQHGERARVSVPLLALIAYWSPMVAIGFAAFALVDICSQNPIKTGLQYWRGYLFSLCLVLPYYLYLARDLSGIENGLVSGQGNVLVSYYAYFAVLALVALYCVINYFSLSKDNRNFLVTALIILLVAPLYHFGFFNDLTKRTTMVAYYALLVIASDAALHLLHTLKPAGNRDPRQVQLGFMAILLMASLASLYGKFPRISSLSAVSFFPPLKESNFMPTATSGLQHEITASRGLIQDLGLKFQYISPLTPVKKGLLRDISTCPAQ